MIKSGRALRLGRLFKGDETPLFLVPLDHTVTDGPFTDARGYDALLGILADNGADAIVVHKGRLRLLPRSVYARLAVVVHLSASTRYAADPTFKYQVAEVEDCLRRGADAVSVHVNVGSLTEDRQLRDMAGVADACDRAGLPLLAMLYPRGPGIKDHPQLETLLHAASLAVDLGADIVKLPLQGPVAAMKRVVEFVSDPHTGGGRRSGLGPPVRHLRRRRDGKRRARTSGRTQHLHGGGSRGKGARGPAAPVRGRRFQSRGHPAARGCSRRPNGIPDQRWRGHPGARLMTTAWIDIRDCKGDEIPDIIAAAAEHRIEGVIFDGEAGGALATRQAGVQWVAFKNGGGPDKIEADICVHCHNGGASGLAASHLRHSKKDGILVDVENMESLEEACAAVRAGLLTVIRFKDPTKIPLEIVLAAGSRRGAKIMTFVSDLSEAKVVMSVLESGPDGVIMTPRSAAEVEALGRLCSPVRGQLALKEFSVTEIADAGTGDRVCVDTCSNFFRDEGLLVGAFGGGFLLCCSETHPLPYMPTRPFRVNAGAVSSYILSSPDRTNYLSELRQGHTVTAVRVNGDTRPVVVGRAKIETRPLLLIKARSADGDEASLMLQYDWHVRMLGRAGAVHNITELTPGSIILGYAAARARHVGMAVDEYCLEQ